MTLYDAGNEHQRQNDAEIDAQCMDQHLLDAIRFLAENLAGQRAADVQTGRSRNAEGCYLKDPVRCKRKQNEPIRGYPEHLRGDREAHGSSHKLVQAQEERARDERDDAENDQRQAPRTECIGSAPSCAGYYDRM